MFNNMRGRGERVMERKMQEMEMNDQKYDNGEII